MIPNVDEILKELEACTTEQESKAFYASYLGKK
jgi:hypothetical protein